MSELDAIQALANHEFDSNQQENFFQTPGASCVKQADSLEDLTDQIRILAAAGIQDPHIQQIQQMIHSGSALTEIKETFAINWYES